MLNVSLYFVLPTEKNDDFIVKTIAGFVRQKKKEEDATFL
jgi:hypothetical protein